jgi:hypothetical protein
MANDGIPDNISARNIRAALGAEYNIPQGLGTDRRFLYGKQMNRIFTDATNASDQAMGFTNAGAFYKPTQYENLGTPPDESVLTAAGGSSSAFSIERDFVEWDIPTSSTNYQRPRTVAAGYSPNQEDPSKGVLTVVFRDGTFYNYYEVNPSEWSAFHSSFSKGRPWLNPKSGTQSSDGLFLSKPRGDAGDMEDVDPRIREALYRVARASQQKTSEKRGRTKHATWDLGSGTLGITPPKGRKKPTATLEGYNRLRSNVPRQAAKGKAQLPNSKGNKKAS